VIQLQLAEDSLVVLQSFRAIDHIKLILYPVNKNDNTL